MKHRKISSLLLALSLLVRCIRAQCGRGKYDA